MAGLVEARAPGRRAQNSGAYQGAYLGVDQRSGWTAAGGPPRRDRRDGGLLGHPPGHGDLSHQGPGILRWALYEAAKCSARPAAPDYADYHSVKQRHDGKLAAPAVACKLARCYHTLRSIDPEEVYATV